MTCGSFVMVNFTHILRGWFTGTGQLFISWNVFEAAKNMSKLYTIYLTAQQNKT